MSLFQLPLDVWRLIGGYLSTVDLCMLMRSHITVANLLRERELWDGRWHELMYITCMCVSSDALYKNAERMAYCMLRYVAPLCSLAELPIRVWLHDSIQLNHVDFMDGLLEWVARSGKDKTDTTASFCQTELIAYVREPTYAAWAVMVHTFQNARGGRLLQRFAGLSWSDLFVRRSFINILQQSPETSPLPILQLYVALLPPVQHDIDINPIREIWTAASQQYYDHDIDGQVACWVFDHFRTVELHLVINFLEKELVTQYHHNVYSRRSRRRRGQVYCEYMLHQYGVDALLAACTSRHMVFVCWVLDLIYFPDHNPLTANNGELFILVAESMDCDAYDFLFQRYHITRDHPLVLDVLIRWANDAPLTVLKAWQQYWSHFYLESAAFSHLFAVLMEPATVDKGSKLLWLTTLRCYTTVQADPALVRTAFFASKDPEIQQLLLLHFVQERALQIEVFQNDLTRHDLPRLKFWHTRLQFTKAEVWDATLCCGVLGRVRHSLLEEMLTWLFHTFQIERADVAVGVWLNAFCTQPWNNHMEAIEDEFTGRLLRLFRRHLRLTHEDVLESGCFAQALRHAHVNTLDMLVKVFRLRVTELNVIASTYWQDLCARPRCLRVLKWFCQMFRISPTASEQKACLRLLQHHGRGADGGGCVINLPSTQCVCLRWFVRRFHVSAAEVMAAQC